MTKYILVGGYASKAGDGGKAFADELVAGFTEPVKLLDCMFARDTSVWESSLADDVRFFARCVPDTNIELRLAFPERFSQDILWADILYFRGGSTSLLMEALRKQGGWYERLEGKTIAGTSAGAYALSKYYFLQKLEGMVGEGFGLVPIKTVAHYRAKEYPHSIDWDLGDKVMGDFAPELEYVKLHEGEYRVFVETRKS
ncbi:MAG: Type 1 glutamine amidotransferase-like domain-containing protein [Candidatus Pacebacteria bacterium]|nr:Type 1 glutamine amidotransferase-like domain-containing protein [Candidatus Paceibacterota bacterium]